MVVPPPPPPPLPSEHASVGLVSVAGGAGRLRADWRTGSADVTTLDFALFVAPDKALVPNATPLPVDVSAGHAIVEGLPVGITTFVQLGVREHVLDRYVPSGPVLAARTSAPRYVDPDVPVGLGDGSTPATPTSDLVLALLDAFVQGGGNVYVTGGEITNTAFPLFTGVQLLGGFDATFDLAARDPDVHVTHFEGVSAQTMFRVENGASGPAVIDGVTLTGSFAVPTAIDVPGLPCEIRDVTMTGMSRGVKVRGLATGPAFDVLVTGAHVSGCEIEGLSVDAAVDVVLEHSTFDANGNEGADFNHLWAPSGTTVHLVARACVFTRNGTEGLDVHLGAPAGGGSAGGRFVIDVSDCDFELNALDGARIDIDYEATPAWSSDIVTFGCRTRANGASGLHYDLDSTSTATVERLSASANSTDGFLLTSESAAGMVTISSSALFGNLGFGARLVQGNFGLVMAHCVVAGNALGGVDSPVVRSSAHSTVFHLQSTPLLGVEAIACVTTSFADPAQFVRAPREYTTISAQSGATLTLAAPTTTGSGLPFEIADDGMPRAVTWVRGTTMIVDPPIDAIRTPARGTFFDAGGSSTEDWRLSGTSSALGAGFAALGAGASDAGVFGAPSSGTPGNADAVRRRSFRLADTSPRWASTITSSTEVRLSFAGSAPAPATVPAAVYGVSANGAVLGTVAFVDGGEIVVAPPPLGWQSGDRIEVHAGLSSTSGTPLAFACVIPLLVP